MRYIVVPQTITLMNEEEDRPMLDQNGAPIVVEFWRWVLRFPLNVKDPMAFSEEAGWDARLDIRDAVTKVPDGKGGTRKAEAGDVIAIENESWKRLCVGVAKANMEPLTASQWKPYREAIKNAAEKKPVIPVAESAEAQASS